MTRDVLDARLTAAGTGSHFRLSGRDLRAEAVAEAHTWLGTPYRHQASVKGWGCDCLGLVSGVWRALHGAEPEEVPPYRPDWAEVGGAETLLDAARRWMVEIAPADARPGDVLLFRMAPGAPMKHCAVLSALPSWEGRDARMVHAYWGRAVVESWLGPWWKRRLAAAFTWPLFCDRQRDNKSFRIGMTSFEVGLCSMA